MKGLETTPCEAWGHPVAAPGPRGHAVRQGLRERGPLRVAAVHGDYRRRRFPPCPEKLRSHTQHLQPPWVAGVASAQPSPGPLARGHSASPAPSEGVGAGLTHSHLASKTKHPALFPISSEDPVQCGSFINRSAFLRKTRAHLFEEMDLG